MASPDRTEQSPEPPTGGPIEGTALFFKHDADRAARLRASDIADFPIPERIGPHRIVRIVGVGGMGIVYEAVQDRPERTVAVKALKPGVVSRKALRRFEREANLLARLQHPNIATVLDVGRYTPTAGGPELPYFAMEFVKGESITTYARNNKLNMRCRIKLFASICDAVEHAHQQGVLHRDLKPANLIVDCDGRPVVLDFGVACLTDSDVKATMQTELGEVVGTLTYMSPEQTNGDSSQLDTRSDVYSLGVVLYELLADRLPYDVGANSSIVHAAQVIREDDPTRLSNADASLKGDLETIVGKALEKEKDRRYQSMSELVADLRRYLRNEPIMARSPSAAYQIHKFASRHKALVAGAVAATMTLSLGAGAATWQAIRATRAQRQAIQRADDMRSLVHSVIFDLHDAIVDLPGASPVRKKLLDSALVYMDNMAGHAGADPQIQLELARAYIKLGDVQGNSHEANLGDMAGARRTYGRAINMLGALRDRQPNDRPTLRALASVYIKRAGILAMAEIDGVNDPALVQKALVINQALVAADPADAGAQVDLALSLRLLGLLARNAGEMDRAITLLTRSRDVLRKLEESGAVEERAPMEFCLAQYWLGYVYDDMKEYEQAVPPLRDALARLVPMLEADPTNMEMRGHLGGVHSRLAMALAGLGVVKEAIQHADKSVEIALALSDESPGNQRTFRTLEVSQGFQAVTFHTLAERSDLPADQRLSLWRRARDAYESAYTMTKTRQKWGWLHPIEAHYIEDELTEIATCNQAIAELQRLLSTVGSVASK